MLTDGSNMAVLDDAMQDHWNNDERIKEIVIEAGDENQARNQSRSLRTLFAWSAQAQRLRLSASIAGGRWRWAQNVGHLTVALTGGH